MPFTFSHPAIILPLKKLTPKWFSMTGLIVGSLLPDFEYFIRMRMRSTFSHNTNSILWFHLPLGILLVFVFHNLIRDLLIDNLPLLVKSRFYYMKNINWNEYFKKKWYVVIYSLLIGVLSHLFWDSFTHWFGYFPQNFPIFRRYIYIFGERYHYLRILQHVSTIVGGTIVVIYIKKLPQCNEVNLKIDMIYWIIIFILFMLIMVLRISAGIRYKDYGELAVNIISAGFISLIATSTIYKIKKYIK